MAASSSLTVQTFAANFISGNGSASSQCPSNRLLSTSRTSSFSGKPLRFSSSSSSCRTKKVYLQRRGLGVTRASAVETLKKKTATDELVEKSVNTIRFLSIDAVEKANSGHPGLPMGCAPMGHILYDEVMRYNPKNPYWFNRDRFVLSAGHGCMLHYSLLHLAGYDSVKVRSFVFSFCQLTAMENLWILLHYFLLL